MQHHRAEAEPLREHGGRVRGVIRDNIENFFENKELGAEQPKTIWSKLKNSLNQQEENDPHNMVSFYSLHTQMNCVVYIQSGVLNLQKSYVSLKCAC